MTDPVLTPEALDSHETYWKEAFEMAFDEAGRFDLIEQLTNAERNDIACALRGSEQNQGLSFYTPPASDQIDNKHDQETAHLKAEIARLESEVEVFRNSVKRRRGAVEVNIDNGSVMYR